MTGIQKISSIVFLVLGGLSIIFAGFYFLGGSVPETVGTPFEEKNFTSLVLIWALVLFIIAALATLIFSFANIFMNPKVLKGFLIILGLGVVLVLISYFMASSEPLTILNLPKEPTPSTLKWVGTGLNMTYILAIVAFVGIIVSEVIRAFK
jgi:magnesium-transporting ATPase (P-type)